MLIEDISEALILTEGNDLPALAGIHTQFQEVVKELEQDGKAPAANAAAACAGLIEDVILGEVDDAEASLEVVSRAVSSLQAVILDGRAPEEVEFPAALGLDSSSSRDNVGDSAYHRPAHIDESLLVEFLAKQISVLDEMEHHILAIESQDLKGAPAELKRLLHTLKGESGLLNLLDIQRLCHEIESCLDAESLPSVDSLLAVKDWLGRAFEGIGRGVCISGADDVIEQLQSAAIAGERSASVQEQGEEESSEGESSPSVDGTDNAASSGATEIAADVALLGEFVTEAREHLEEADLKLLALETSSDDTEALNSVFRSFHTIKGTAAFLNLEDIGKLAHEAESLLNMARNGEIALRGRAVDVCLEAVDVLRVLLDAVEEAIRNDTSLQPHKSLGDLISRIQAASKQQDQSDQHVEAEQLSKGTGAKLGEILVDSDRLSAGQLVDALVEQKTTHKGEKLGEVLVKSGRATARDIVEALREQKSGVPIESEQQTAAPQLGELMVEAGTVTSEEVLEAVVEQETSQKRKKIGEMLVSKGRASAEDVSQALRAQRSGVSDRSVAAIKEVIKVDALRLDRLVDMIGELVIAESMVSQSEELLEGASAEMTRHVVQLDKITRELQEMGMSLRMVPVKATFQKMARLVRDLAKKAGKQVELVLSGEDTELDKTVVDKIGDPLVHMVRNAVDHGIESNVQERRQRGKRDKGRVELRAFHKGGNIYIEIQDDGRGLDREVILAKGKERGLVRDGETLSDREVFNLVFEPGFSTAKKVTDVSGRGVGMDVVKRNITDLRGNVEISSELGKGSTFSIRLPLTLAIIDGMLLRVGDERYIIPTLSIVGAVRPEREALQSVLDRGETLFFQGRLIPLFAMGRLFGIERAEQDASSGVVIVVEDDGLRVGLIADELLGLRQTVIKSMGDVLGKQDGVAGATILSDGRVGLILDVSGIMKLINQGGAIHLSHSSSTAPVEQDDSVLAQRSGCPSQSTQTVPSEQQV